MNDPIIGSIFEGYKIEKSCGKGEVGRVYKAISIAGFNEVRAIKIIPRSNLRAGWEKEIEKVNILKNTDGVVKFIKHGDDSDKDHIWIAWEYIEGDSLKDLISSREITLPILVDVIMRALAVMHSCAVMQIAHGDLHAGNILLEKQNPIYLDSNFRRIWITDFGYATAYQNKEMLDDFRGLHRIVADCLSAINFSSLDTDQKYIYQYIKDKFLGQLLETDKTQGEWVRNPKKLHQLFIADSNAGENIAQGGKTSLADYLAAEHLGDRYDEWKNLYVPDYVDRSQLLQPNICVLTGLRGCGKTMTFRRLTALFDAKMKESVPGASHFLGFYINARSIAEAFPWLPPTQEAAARSQVVHYFHLCYCLEIIDWLRVELPRESHSWLVDFIVKYFATPPIISEGEATELFHVQAFLEKQQENSRLKGQYVQRDWPLDDLQFLDKLFAVLVERFPKFREKPVFLFLDDYSTPLLTSTAQKILNPVIFRRSARVYFKVATESVESFEPITQNNKVLEDIDDYILVDTSTYTINLTEKNATDLLEKLLRPRLKRELSLDPSIKTLRNVLGKTNFSQNGLARQLKNTSSKVDYYGDKCFCSIFSGNVREMISLMADMLLQANPQNIVRDAGSKEFVISKEIQNQCFRTAGGQFLALLQSATNPTNTMAECSKEDVIYGNHLASIAMAFGEISKFDLKTKTSKNQKGYPIKQARRIEITNVDKDLPDDIKDYYKGLVRYGVFIRDYRGKSVRGKAVPRLVLRGLLVPYFAITFSKRDNITMNWNDFCYFLKNPKQAAQKYISKGATANTPDFFA
jgi:serine/threonine protein kinase